jgi:hypothetical protein
MNMPRWPRYPIGLDFVSFETSPSGVTPEIVVLKAEDGGTSRGVLYSTGRERTVVCLMHPRADMTRHYIIPHLVESGYAFFAQESRWAGTDIATIHEVLLADVAAAMTHLRGRNFDFIVLLGNSGAGSLYSLYQAQAVTAPPGRLTDTAAGDPYDLNTFNMPSADGMIFLGAHLGAGRILQTEVDPSVIDEGDPPSCDPELDMYNPENGFREPPEPSTYAEDFLARYRAAQAIRVARIDAIARNHISNQRAFRTLAENDVDASAENVAAIRRRALLGRYMQVHRLDANPGSIDPTLQPSKRTYGSLMSARPDLSNYAEPGTKVLTPRAWLSSWSGLSSRAAVLQSLPKITIPTFVANYSADNAIYPTSSDRIYEQSPAADKSRAEFEGDHFGLTSTFERKPRGPKSAATVIEEWLTTRFGLAKTMS